MQLVTFFVGNRWQHRLYGPNFGGVDAPSLLSSCRVGRLSLDHLAIQVLVYVRKMRAEVGSVPTPRRRRIRSTYFAAQREDLLGLLRTQANFVECPTRCFAFPPLALHPVLVQCAGSFICEFIYTTKDRNAVRTWAEDSEVQTQENTTKNERTKKHNGRNV